MKFFSSRSRSAMVTRRLGLVLGMAAVGVGLRVWTEQGRGPRSTDRPIAAQGSLHGRAHIADGDSVVIAGTRLRLVGIDAPELAQACRRDEREHPCGQEAKAHLEAIVAGQPIDCVWERRDKYGRGLARCRAGSVDLGAAMVRDGWAVSYGGYEAEEAEARRARRALWAESFEWPEDFRRRERDERAW